MGKLGIIELLVMLAVMVLFFFLIRALLLWYYKIDERLIQQYETNRLLRKLAGEPSIDTQYLISARNKTQPSVSAKIDAEADVNRNLL